LTNLFTGFLTAGYTMHLRNKNLILNKNDAMHLRNKNLILNKNDAIEAKLNAAVEVESHV
jgi:hypothetical protein